uniref:Thymic stromal lymphopoietin n=1 Tax=Balaenoptera musculus TaxID=9771 RepID=A0A8C0CG08_BALMU
LFPFISISHLFFRKIFILQLVELVLTYNFTDCDFKKIKDIYQDVIHPELNIYIKGVSEETFLKCISIVKPDCLIKIEHFTFKPIYGCVSLAKETFAKQTNATLSLECSGYSGIQINNTQTMKKRRKREVKTDKCLEQVSYLIELWRRFSRIS